MPLVQVIMLPGLGGSGPDHWQHMWASACENSSMVEVSDWNDPQLEDWLQGVDRAVEPVKGEFAFVAHSLGCALAAQWMARAPKEIERLKGVMMVAPADIDDAAYTPECSHHFGPMPVTDLGRKTITVISTDDPYVSTDRATAFNEAWNGRLVNLGDKGHINGQSGLGDWPEGKELLAELLN